MNNLEQYVPQVHFEQIPIKNLVSNQEYQRNLSLAHIQRAAENFDLYQINPVKVSRRDGINYVFNGQHTIEIVALVSGSRETPVWCMVYDELCYEHEADIFANQMKFVKPLSAYEIFIANKATKIPFPKLFDITEEYVPYAWETNNQIKRAVRCVLSLAKKNRLVVENYAKAEYIEYPPKRKAPIMYMDDETAAKFADFLMEKCSIRDKAALLTALLTGFRRGEIAGLEWRDIDFEKNTIAVNRSVVYLPKYGIFEKEPKTQGSIRVTAAPQLLIDTLKEYKEYWNNLRAQCGDYIKPSQKLFTKENGDLINPCSVYQWLQRIIQKMDIGHYTLHSLRHTNISIQLAAGVPLITVSVRAGHSRTSTTGDIYSHIIQSSDRQAAETLNNIFSRKQTTEED